MSRWLLLLSIVSALALAGPFEQVPFGDPLHRDLERLHAYGLTADAVVGYEPGESVTRFDAAVLWQAAYRELQARLDTRAGGFPVRQVSATLGRMLQPLESELADLGVDIAEAERTLETLPTALSAGSEAASRPSPRLRLNASPALRTLPAPTAGPAERMAFGFSESLTGQTDTDLRVSAGLFGDSQAGLSVREVPVVEYDDLGPSRLMVGHVLAADLRLRLGDNSVILEYGRSLADTVFGAQPEDQVGQALKAGFLQHLSNSLSLGFSYRRMSSGFGQWETLFPFEGGPDLYGFEAGLNWQRESFGIRSEAAVFLPEGSSVGYVNRLGTEISYTPNDEFQFGLAYMGASRRRLATLEDAWRNYLQARVVYEVGSRLQANLNYRFESDDRLGAEGSREHTVGAALGLGF